jgi:hypothetical protein
MKTRPIPKPVKRTHNLHQKIKDALLDCFEHNAFSTFPYIVDGYTSKQAINKTNSGNCISLSMFIKDQLMKRYGVSSHLVPATVPSYIYKEGYLDVCHVSLVVPINASSYYLIDPAFYFLEPVLVNMKQVPQPVRSMNIYDNKVDIVHPKLKSYGTRTKLNDYQSFPKDTKYCQCHYNDKSDDTWNYYLREIVNPDQAISKFFIAIRNEPFFVSTKLDQENKCMKDLIIRTHKGEDVSIKLNDETIYDGPVYSIPSDKKQMVEKLLHSRGFDHQLLTF